MSLEPKLHIVKPGELPTETLAERIRGLQAEARKLADQHLSSLVASLMQAEAIAAEIAEGGPLYHDGAQERARQIAKEIESQRTTLSQILDRAQAKTERRA